MNWGRVMNRPSLIGALFLLVSGFAQAATVDVRPTVVQGVSILSAELVPELDSSTGILVVRVRNDGALPGQTVHLFTSVRDAEGYGKCGGGVRIEVNVPIGSEQVLARRVDKSLDAADALTVGLVDINDPTFSVGGDWCEFCETCKTTALQLCGSVQGVSSWSCSCSSQDCDFTCNTPE